MPHSKPKKPKTQFKNLIKGILQDQKEGRLPKYNDLKIVTTNQQEVYLILDQLGEGGQGIVRKALNLHTNLTCAVKVVSKEHREYDEIFYRELFFLNKANRLQDFATFDSQYPESYLFMDCYSGDELISCLYDINNDVSQDSPARNPNKKNLSFNYKLELCLSVIRAVLELHEIGILHRDINPRNFVISDNPQLSEKAKLVDLATAASNQAQSRTSDAVLGSSALAHHPLNQSIRPEHYMLPFSPKGYLDQNDPTLTLKYGAKGYTAPEFFQSDPSIQFPTSYSFAQDYYSLGVLLAEIWSVENYQQKIKTLLNTLDIQLALKRDGKQLDEDELDRVLNKLANQKSSKEKIRGYIQTVLSEEHNEIDIPPEIIAIFLPDIYMVCGEKVLTTSMRQEELHSDSESSYNLREVRNLREHIHGAILKLCQSCCETDSEKRVDFETLKLHYLNLLENYLLLKQSQTQAHSPRETSGIVDVPNIIKRKQSAPNTLQNIESSQKQGRVKRFLFSSSSREKLSIWSPRVQSPKSNSGSNFNSPFTSLSSSPKSTPSPRSPVSQSENTSPREIVRQSAARMIKKVRRKSLLGQSNNTLCPPEQKKADVSPSTKSFVFNQLDLSRLNSLHLDDNENDCKSALCSYGENIAHYYKHSCKKQDETKSDKDALTGISILQEKLTQLSSDIKQQNLSLALNRTQACQEICDSILLTQSKYRKRTP